MNQEEQARKMSQLIAKCWADEAFKRKVLADPAATLRAEGLELPAGLSYVVHENTDKVVHLVIPAKPTVLSDEDLNEVVGGLMAVSSSEGSPEMGKVWGVAGEVGLAAAGAMGGVAGVFTFGAAL
jgi:hypothetical protein